ncbi:hypothetical protein SAMN05216436_11672 [bacterium A37T11]|nr:hypothetical protein SAMN05216436_11672 [bacterium A37T11]
MRTERVLLSYEKWSDYALATLAGRTLSFMTNNEFFPDQQEELVPYGVLVTDFRAKHEIASKGGSSLDNSAKKLSRIALLKAMKTLAFEVNKVSDGNANMLLSSGFMLASQPQESEIPDVPTLITLSNGRQKGQMRMDFAAVPGAYEYEYQVGTIPEGSTEISWGESLFTPISRGNVISPVIYGTTYYVQVRARNKKGVSDWADPVSWLGR